MGSRKKVAVVTGGAGFLGSHLCDRLLEEGCRVFSSPAAKALQHEKTEIRNAFFDYLRSMRTNEAPHKIKRKYLNFTSLYKRKKN